MRFLWPLKVIVSDTKIENCYSWIILVSKGLYFTEWHLPMAATVITMRCTINFTYFYNVILYEGITGTGKESINLNKEIL